MFKKNDAVTINTEVVQGIRAWPAGTEGTVHALWPTPDQYDVLLDENIVTIRSDFLERKPQ